ncbi:hypothetical protein EDD22DRAFT_11623 [Suillus occidentalis]|nr:hypothetical protein EDD22DRAFT_11623 [Suillus occidentalis]
MDNDDDGRIYDNHLSGRTSQPPSPDHCTVTSHESPLRCIEEDGLHESWVDDSGYADMDTTETGNLHGFIPTHDLLDPQRYPLSPPNSFPFSFGSISQGTEEQILDMDTSPLSSQSSFSQLRGGWSSNREHLLKQSSPTSPITSSAPIPESSRWNNSVKCSSPISQSLCHTSDVKQFSASSFETQYAPTTSQNTQKIFHDAQNSEAVEKSFAEISNTGHRRPFQASYCSAARTGPAGSHTFDSWRGFSFRDSDTYDPGLPLDILNDPDPWATIGKILNLEIVEEHDNDINLNHGREGVGYVRHRLDKTAHVWNPPRNSMIRLGSIKSESEDQSKAMVNDEVEEHLGEPTDHCFYQSQHSENEERPSLNHSIPAKHMKFADQNESLCILTVAESEVQTESRCNPAALVHQVPPRDVQCSGIDDDMYGGPCLFEDSDEEDG